MSVTLGLTALGLAGLSVVAGTTITGSALLTFLGSRSEEEVAVEAECIQTVYVDGEILAKTLGELGCCVNVVSENEIIVETSCGNLRYARSSAAEAFGLYINEVNDPQALIENLKAFEFQYGKNIQAYTYDHILSNLGEDMTFQEEEILEDDSLLLTISID